MAANPNLDVEHGENFNVHQYPQGEERRVINGTKCSCLHGKFCSKTSDRCVLAKNQHVTASVLRLNIKK